MSSIHIIFASTSGNTEYVVDTVIAAMKKANPKLEIEKQRAESAVPEDMLRGDSTILACGSWNTGSVEGQMNPYMHEYLLIKSPAVDLQKHKMAVIGLGDERYHYLAKAREHMENFVTAHNGTLLQPSFVLVNDPYGQEKKIQEWVKQFLTANP